MFGKSDCIRKKRLNLVVVGKSGYILAKWLYSDKSSCI